LNGIELIRRIRENGRDTRVIIISGFRQFEDANQAIKYGVEDYLLKPLKQKELERVLRKIIQRHNQEWESTEERDLMRRQVNQSIMQVKAQWFYLLLSGAAPQGDKGAVPAFAGPLFQIIQFRAVPLMGGADIQGVLNRKVYEILEGELTGSFREVVPIMQETASTADVRRSRRLRQPPQVH
jgi:hypothetical protein